MDTHTGEYVGPHSTILNQNSKNIPVLLAWQLLNRPFLVKINLTTTSRSAQMLKHWLRSRSSKVRQGKCWKRLMESDWQRSLRGVKVMLIYWAN